MALVLFGFFPQPLLDVINPSVDTTLTELGVTSTDHGVPASGIYTAKEMLTDLTRQSAVLVANGC